ncbi:MAG: thioredoxin domain-containing protein [Longimicrobiales bacterium]|nr:thioredoxin domain-containing protein [Longimicrobiales bacterium]
MSLRIVPLLVVAGVLGACSEGGDAPGTTNRNVSAELLESRDLLSQEPAQNRSSASGSVREEVGAFLQAHLPQSVIDLDTLGYNFGDPDAPIKLLEFSDFGCEYCRRFHLETFPALHAEYIETGKVYWKYVPMLLGVFPNAIEAAQVGECVGEQGRFLEVTHLLFERQSAWMRSRGDPMPALLDIVEEAGADPAAVAACVEEDRHATRIASGTGYFTRVGGRGTPSFFIIDVAPIPGAIPLELFREVLDTAYVTTMRERAGGGGA